MEILEAAGKTIREKYCNKNKYIKEREAIMFPPAPNLSSFIDAFHRETLSNKEKIEKQRQDEYEAEVEVFRALEREENIIVLHGLKYTHQQYSFCVPSHESSDCKKKDLEEEGECDFVVIGDNFLAVLEVKSPDMNSKNPEKMFSDRYKESINQRVRTIDMINGIFQQTSSSENPVIFEFSVFNRMRKEDVQRFAKYKSLTADALKKIALKDDMDYFKHWWRENIISKVTEDMQPLDNRPVNVLLGLWCADNKNNCDVEKCSLANCILEIDDKLKSEIITRVPKGPINKDVKGASPVFKKYLGIECLTSQQAEIFKSKKNFLWITGPAGSGKSILLLGKILDIVEKNRSKAKREGGLQTDNFVLLAFGEKSLDIYKPVLEKAGLKCFSFSLGRFNENMVNFSTASTILDALQESVKSNDYDVLIVFSVSGASIATLDHYASLFELFNDHNIFIDDAHYLFSYSFCLITDTAIKSFVDKLRNCNNDRITWAGLDIAQFSYHSTAIALYPLMRNVTYSSLVKELEDSLVSLSANLRNSVEIADLLKVLRSEVLNTVGDKDNIPLQTRGHYIHGLIPKIYIMKDSEYNFVEHVLETELKKLSELSSDKVGYVYRLQHAISKKWDQQQDKIQGRKGHLSNIPSSEWPAVVAYVCESQTMCENFKSELYLAASRARVYLVIVILLDPSEGSESIQISEFVERLESGPSVVDVIHVRQIYDET